MSRWSHLMAMALGLWALGTVGSAPALASSPRDVRVGAAPTLPPRARAVGALAPPTRLRVALTLEPRDPAALAAYATAVATPGSGVYGRYLTVAQFAQRFGPTRDHVATVESALRSQGLDPGAVTANGLAIDVSATAAQLARAFSIGFQRVTLPGGRTAFANTAAPSLPASAAGYVQGVVGLDTLAVPHPVSLVRRRPHAASSASAPHVVTGGPQPCATATIAALAQGAYTADELASAYRFSALYGAGDQGAGQTVAIYELEPNLASDIAAYQACYGTSASVSYVPVDGGVGSGAGTGEAALDIEDVIGLAPRANIIVYQGPNSGSGSPGAGPYDIYAAIISQDRAAVISTSWGVCEAAEGSTNAAAESTLFAEAAVQGQTIIAASGDSGSEDCGTAALAVDDPGGQPLVTSVGGTSLNALGPPPSEVVWNGGCPQACGGGGGISALWQMPSYQSGAPAAVNVLSSLSSGVPCRVAAGSCREVPDVSADASPATGYVIYWHGSGLSTDPAAWEGIGGTSAAAPLWAALIALANASSACAGTPIGFANPALYRVAGTGDYANAFNDVTAGNNDILGANGGLYPAGPAYDMATGLGTPIASNLAGYLCDRVTVTNPGTENSVAGTAVSLPVTGASSVGATLHYAATGLPAGLSINAATGVVSGAPTTPGSSSVNVTATSADGLSGSTSFLWNVLAVAVQVTNPGAQTGTVGTALRVHMHASDNNGRALSYAATRLPAGLSIGRSSGLISGTPTAAGSSTVTVKVTDAGGGASGTASFPWVVTAAASVSRASLSGVGAGKPKLSFTVSAAPAAASIARIVIALPKGLKFTGKTRGIALRGPGGKRVRFTARVSRGELIIGLRAPVASVKVTISGASFSLTSSRGSRSGLVQATNSGNTTTRLPLTLGV